MLATSKILVNQWRNEPSSRDLLGHHLAFTKTGQEPEHEHFLLSKGSQGDGCMVAFVQVARIGDVPSGKLLAVNLHGQPMLLANVDGTIYALSGMCSHADGPLTEGSCAVVSWSAPSMVAGLRCEAGRRSCCRPPRTSRPLQCGSKRFYSGGLAVKAAWHVLKRNGRLF
jgi:Rieske [2Fe-2S] domain